MLIYGAIRFTADFALNSEFPRMPRVEYRVVLLPLLIRQHSGLRKLLLINSLNYKYKMYVFEICYILNIQAFELH